MTSRFGRGAPVVVALLSVALGCSSDALPSATAPAEREGETVAEVVDWVRPASATGSPFRYSDLIAFDDQQKPHVAEATPSTSVSVPLAAAFALTFGPPDRGGSVPDLPAAMSTGIAAAVDRIEAGDANPAAMLADLLLYQRLTEGRVTFITAADIDRLTATMAATPASAASDLDRTLLLRIELALVEDDPAVADTLARLPEDRACALAAVTGQGAGPLVALLSFELQRPMHRCVSDNAQRLALELADQIDATSAVTLARSGLAGVPAAQAAVTAWLADQDAARAVSGYIPSELQAFVAASFGSRTPASSLLESSARRVTDTGGQMSDRISADVALDAYLFAELDHATGLEPWAPGALPAAQLGAAGSSAQLLVFGLGRDAGDPRTTELVSTLEQPCAAADDVDLSDQIVPPFAVVSVAALEVSRGECPASAAAAAAAVFDGRAVPAGSSPVVRTWASGYVGCRYSNGADDDAELRAELRTRDVNPAAPWSFVDAPTDYYAMFDSYAAGWLDAFVDGHRSCSELTPWSSS